MNKELIDILACPVCKGSLQLEVTEENDSEVIKGSLNCAQCSHIYPIDDSIPNLLPPEIND